MSIDTLTADIGKASGILTSVSADVAAAMTAYALLKSIWLRMNPGKTEQDFLDYLQTSSQSNIDDASAQLLSDGWVLSADGKTWSKA